jgi:hypothetical protein
MDINLVPTTILIVSGSLYDMGKSIEAIQFNNSLLFLFYYTNKCCLFKNIKY